MNIKNRLKISIDELGLKIVDFSKKTSIPYQTLMNYLNGNRQPTTENLQKISIHTNINITWLLTGEGEMFISDRSEKVINSGMPPEFIEKLRDDIKNKDDSFFASLSMSKDKLFDVLIGKTRLSRLEVIELSRKLNQSLDEYVYIAGYLPEEFTRVLKNPRMMESLRTAGKLSDKDINQAITAFQDVLKEFEKRHPSKKK